MAAAAAQAQIQAFLTSITFMPIQVEALINQGINSFDILKVMSDTEIHEICIIIHRQPRIDPANRAQFLAPVPIPVKHEHYLKLAAYACHLDCTQRAFVFILAMPKRLEEIQILKEEEKEVKEKKITPLTKLESIAKIRVTIENIYDHLFKL